MNIEHLSETSPLISSLYKLNLFSKRVNIYAIIGGGCM